MGRLVAKMLYRIGLLNLRLGLGDDSFPHDDSGAGFGIIRVKTTRIFENACIVFFVHYMHAYACAHKTNKIGRLISIWKGT